MLWDRCLSVLSVTLVYCGQKVGWIKMKLGVEVGLGSGYIVLDGDPAPPLPKGHNPPQFSAHISCGQTAGWIKIPLGREVGLGPGDILLNGDPTPPPEKGAQQPPHFLAHVYCGQMAGWIKVPFCMEVGIGPGHTVLGGDPAPLPQKRGTAANFLTMSVVDKWLDGSRCHFVRR